MHIPVLQKEVIEYLDPKPNENFIDGTFGGGGHSFEILKMNIPFGRVLGIETDAEMYLEAKKNIEGISGRLILVNDSYLNIEKIAERHNFRPVSGVLLDLGMSNWHLEQSGRGFSFQKDEPLDMRFATSRDSLTAEEIVNRWPAGEIEKILEKYGEERFSRRIAENIAGARKIKPIKSTFDLVEIIRHSVPAWYCFKRTHFATKTFQALRVAVNNELESVESVLPKAVGILEKGGRLAVISFHSLEDRIVKNFFRENKKQGIVKIITKKPVSPRDEEIRQNPRSRSAKLRVCIKI